MKGKRYTEEQIVGFLKEAEAGVPVKELCRQHGFSEQSFYLIMVCSIKLCLVQ